VDIVHGLCLIVNKILESLAETDLEHMGNPASTGTNGNGSNAASGRNALGRFTAGHGGVGGRKVGSRSRLSESFLADLHAEWKRTGRKVLAQVAATEPAVFLRCVATVLPKALEVDNQLTLTTRSELAVEIADFRQAWDAWGRVIGVDQKLIENIENEDSDDDQESDSAT
jgi:hypothetical protein